MTLNKFFSSKEFFPISMYFEEANGEAISIEKRPRLTDSDIIDIYSNGSHVGMIIQIRKLSNELIIGPSTINKTHDFRSILNFTFVKLLEYYGLDGIEKIEVEEAKNIEFRKFLNDLGFTENNGVFYCDISGDNCTKFLEKIESMDIKILNRKEQIYNIISFINADKSKEEIDQMAENIIAKIKKQEEVDETYWENLLVSQLNVMLSTARVFKDKLDYEEFFDLCIKTIIGYFDIDLKIPLFKEFVSYLQGKGFHPISNIQKVIEQMKDLFAKEIEHINMEKYIEWIKKNLPIWRRNRKIKEQFKKQKELASKLKISDFGESIPLEIQPLIQSIVNHYNGEIIFFGIETKI
ncbi:MAG: hypothetical protein ACTSO9_00725 [Candidatus Helarchaeota archaeon]